MDTSAIAGDLSEHGYTIVRSVFRPDEVEALRESMTRSIADRSSSEDNGEGTRHEDDASGFGDLLSNERLGHLVYDERVLECVRDALHDQPVYFGDSSFALGSTDARGWHRDNVDRGVRGADWDAPYPIIRCGIYLQDHAEHSGGLALRARSHRASTVGTSTKARLNRKLRTRAVLVPSRPGDLVLWNLRIIHSGEAVRARVVPLAFSPRVQSALPRPLRAPHERTRMAAFITYGRDDPLLDRYIEYLKTRDYAIGAWHASRLAPDTLARAHDAGLVVRPPVPEYGKPVRTPRRGDDSSRSS